MELIVFTDVESDLIDCCLNVVKGYNNKEDIEKIDSNVFALVELARAISQYPSILGSEHIGHTTRSIATLVEMLCKDEGRDKILHIPTKAVLGKGFLIAKLNLYHMLRYMADDYAEIAAKLPEINDFITKTIFTIMSEEVFLSIIENSSVSEEVRNRAGFLIANIWEYRLNYSIVEFAPILNSVWEARKSLAPVYGTMMGVAELASLSANIDPVWLEFLSQRNEADEDFEALEEFIFSLTFEELIDLRAKMKERKISLVKRSDVEMLLENKRLYADFSSVDPRELYRFFRERKVNAKFRKRAGVPGPKNTIEEIIMCFILSSTDWATRF